ncbi:MAG: MATE family efflux transporter [Alistipes sp.]|nr:MATE family efflux transporter [Alistipes sp.]
MSKQVTTLSLGTDPISRLLPRFAIPAIIAMTSTAIFNIVDSIFIGRGVGALALSSMTLTMPLMSISAAFGSMVGVGAAATTSIRLGQGNKCAAERTLGNLVLLNIVVGIMIGVVGYIVLDPVLHLFNVSEETISKAREFMQVILAGNVITHLYLGLNEMMRASGYPQKSMYAMLTAVAVNCILNPLFIFKFGWGIRGSAFSTIIAQTLAMTISLHHFSRRDSFLHFKRHIFRFDLDIIKKILSIGMAPFLMNLCSAIVVFFVNSALSKYDGDQYVGAFGTINRMVMLFIMIVLGLNQGMQPIVGYNYGARKYDRVIKAYTTTVICALCVTTTGFLISRFMPEQVARLFVKANDADAEALVEATVYGMKYIMVMFWAVGFQIVTGNFFQYIGKPKRAILISMTRQMLFLVPLLHILPPLFAAHNPSDPTYGVTGVWMAQPIADTMSVCLAGVLIFFQMRRLKRNPDSEESI